MNSIAEDFLKEINSHIIVDGDNITVNQVSLAESLAGKTERFTYWKDFQMKKGILWMNEDKTYELFDWDIEFTLPDLYAWWLLNIDNK